MFLKWFPLWLWHALINLAVSGEAFFSKEAWHFELVGRGIILFKFQFYFCEEFGPFLYHICYTGAENVCHLILRAELTHPASSQLPALSLCRPVFMPPVCLLSLTFCFVSWWVVLLCLSWDNKGFRVQHLFCSLPLFTSIVPLCFPFSLFLQKCSHINTDVLTDVPLLEFIS